MRSEEDSSSGSKILEWMVVLDRYSEVEDERFEEKTEEEEDLVEVEFLLVGLFLDEFLGGSFSGRNVSGWS